MLYIPNTLATWPWRRQISPHYEEVKAASRAWVDKHARFFKRGLEELEKADVGQWILCHVILADCFDALERHSSFSISVVCDGHKGFVRYRKTNAQ